MEFMANPFLPRKKGSLDKFL
uniref:Uncharacterized protein n=1 Tax=Rhizophora mucronata TaxID=61149 RepID=A0A2P2JCN6_RHIMU